jgi:argininosuccinate lyase
MRAAITPEMFATDRALDLARAGTPFRDAYRAVKKDVDAAPANAPEASLLARVSPGGTADLRLSEIRGRLEQARSALACHRDCHAATE